jgi:hypothetical protein
VTYRRILVLGALALATAGCASVHSANQTVVSTSTTHPSPATAATTPTNPAISTLMLGTAHPTIPPLVPGKVTILTTGAPVSDFQSATVTVMVGNGTSNPISHVVVAVNDVGPNGNVLQTGGSVGFTPTVVPPGQVTFGYAEFSASASPGSPKLVPAGSKLQANIVSYSTAPTSLSVDAKVTRATFEAGQIVGSIANSSSTAMAANSTSVQAYCFDQNGKMLGESQAIPDGTTDLAVGASTTFSIPLLEPPCPTFLVGAWGISSQS